MKRNKLILFPILLLGFILSSNAQSIGAKTNLAYWGVVGSPNMQLEMAVSNKVSLELGGGFNLWRLDQGKKAKHWLVQPEVRYWFCEAFNGHFVGVHGHGGKFNIGGWDIPVGRLSHLKDHRYQGYLYGAGVSYGYQWILTPRLNLELSLGGGYARMQYDRFACDDCGVQDQSGVYDYWGVTRVGFSLVYLIK